MNERAIVLPHSQLKLFWTFFFYSFCKRSGNKRANQKKRRKINKKEKFGHSNRKAIKTNVHSSRSQLNSNK